MLISHQKNKTTYIFLISVSLAFVLGVIAYSYHLVNYRNPVWNDLTIGKSSEAEVLDTLGRPQSIDEDEDGIYKKYLYQTVWGPAFLTINIQCECLVKVTETYPYGRPLLPLLPSDKPEVILGTGDIREYVFVYANQGILIYTDARKPPEEAKALFYRVGMPQSTADFLASPLGQDLRFWSKRFNHIDPMWLPYLYKPTIEELKTPQPPPSNVRLPDSEWQATLTRLSEE